MGLHLFRDGASDVFALTVDRSGDNLPCTQESDWQFLETIDPIKFAWGEEAFGEADQSLKALGYFLFEGEMIQPEQATSLRQKAKKGCRSGR